MGGDVMSVGWMMDSEKFFKTLSMAVCGPHCNATSMLIRHPIGDDVCQGRMTDLICHKALLQAIESPESCPMMKWDDYSAKYAGLLANFCDKREYIGTTEEIVTK